MGTLYTDEPTGDWTLLRAKANDGAPGTFADDPDYAGTNTVPPQDELQSFQGQLAYNGGFRTRKLVVMVIPVDANDAPVDRGAFGFSITLTEVAQTSGNELEFQPPPPGPVFVIDDEPVRGQTSSRRIVFEIEKGQYGFRLSDFVAVPATAEELRVYVKAA